MTTQWVPPIPGIHHYTGEPDTGKTVLSLTMPGVLPEDIIFLDGDVKTRSMAKQFAQSDHAFGYYVDLIETARKKKAYKPIDFFKMVYEECIPAARQKVPNAKVIVYDNWSPRMEEAIRAKAMTILSQLSDVTEGQARSMSMLTWNPTYYFYSTVMEEMLEMAPVLVIITHIKAEWAGQVKTGKLESRGQRPLIERANLRLWLRHNGDPADGGAPIGLVMKRASKMQISPTGIKAVNVFPERIKPCTWEKICEYLETPVGSRPLTKDEQLNDFERSLVYAEMTEDQKEAIRLSRVLEEHGKGNPNDDVAAMLATTAETTPVGSEAAPLTDEQKSMIAKIKEQGEKPPAMIARVLGITMEELVKYRALMG